MHRSKLKTKKQSFFGIKANFSDSYLRFSLLTFFLCIVLFYLSRLSLNGGSHNLSLSIIYVLVSYGLLQASYFLDNYRFPPSLSATSLEKNYGLFINWIIYVVGIMLIFQVLDNYHLGWFSEEGYRQLVTTYAQTTHKTFSITEHLLYMAANHSLILYQIQRVVEVAIAIGLCIRVLLAPMLLGATGLIVILTWVELGVSPTWPPVPGGETNWLWELLLTSLILIVCFFVKIKTLLKQNSIRSWLCDITYTKTIKAVYAVHMINIIALLFISLAIRKLTGETGLTLVLIDSICCVLALIIIASVIKPYRAKLYQDE